MPRSRTWPSTSPATSSLPKVGCTTAYVLSLHASCSLTLCRALALRHAIPCSSAVSNTTTALCVMIFFVLTFPPFCMLLLWKRFNRAQIPAGVCQSVRLQLDHPHLLVRLPYSTVCLLVFVLCACACARVYVRLLRCSAHLLHLFNIFLPSGVKRCSVLLPCSLPPSQPLRPLHVLWSPVLCACVCLCPLPSLFLQGVHQDDGS